MNEQNKSTPESEPLVWSLNIPIIVKLALGVPAYFILICIAVILFEIGLSLFTLAWLMCPVVLGVSALAFQYFQPRDLILWDDRLEYPQRNLFRTTYKSISFSEINAAVDVDHALLKTSTLVISDIQGRSYLISQQHLRSEIEYLAFRNTLIKKVEKSGNTIRVEAQDNLKNEKVRELKVRDIFVPHGFILLLFLVFGMQWFLQNGNAGISEGIAASHLVDMGGLLQSSIIDGRWDRIFTSSLLHNHIVELILGISVLLVVCGPILASHIGTARITIIILLGCLAGSLMTLVIGSDEVVVGAWSGVYAIWAATLYICFYYRSKMIIIFRSNLVPGLICFGVYGILVGYFYSSLTIIGFFAAAGIGTGFLTIHLFLSSKSLFDPASRAEIAVATILATLYLIGLTTSFWHFFIGL